MKRKTKAQPSKPVFEMGDEKYPVDEMTAENQARFNHINNINRKIEVAQFNLIELVRGRDAFVEDLVKGVKEPNGETDTN